jgi:hypothetical protein
VTGDSGPLLEVGSGFDTDLFRAEVGSEALSRVGNHLRFVGRIGPKPVVNMNHGHRQAMAASQDQQRQGIGPAGYGTNHFASRRWEMTAVQK